MMSQTVTVTKNVDVEISVTVDYLKCDECGQALDFDASVDGDGDLQIKVAKCDSTE